MIEVNIKQLKRYLIFGLIFFSILTGGVITTYLEEYEKKLLMPIRNKLVLGVWKSQTDCNIPTTIYKNGEYTNPVHIAQTVLTTARIVLEDQDIAKMNINSSKIYDIIDIAKYFESCGERHVYNNTEFMVWPYNFDYPIYGISAPWISGMAQGYIIEIMLAVYRITNEHHFLQTACLAANSMAVPIDYGGIAIELNNAGLWFEEYAKQGILPPCVLNGHNFALEGLWYLSLADKSYKQLFEKGIKGLKLLLPKFDVGIWSRYDLTGIPANRKYQKIHAKQLQKLYEITNEPLFLIYAKNFKKQLYYPFTAFYRIIVYPNRFLVSIFIGNIIIAFLLSFILVRCLINLKYKYRKGKRIDH